MSNKKLLALIAIILYATSISPYAFIEIRREAREAVLSWAGKQDDLAIDGVSVAAMRSFAKDIPTIAISHPIPKQLPALPQRKPTK